MYYIIHCLGSIVHKDLSKMVVSVNSIINAIKSELLHGRSYPREVRKPYSKVFVQTLIKVSSYYTRSEQVVGSYLRSM